MANWEKHCLKCFYNQKENVKKYGLICVLCYADRENQCTIPEGTDITKHWKNMDSDK